MDFNLYVTKMLEDNKRGQYLLENIYMFQRNGPKLDLSASKSVLKIIAYSCSQSSGFSQEEKLLFYECGYLIWPAIQTVLNEIKEMGEELSQTIYCVLYEKYCRRSGVSNAEVLAAMKNYGMKLNEHQLERYLELGVSLFSSLIFQTRQEAAMLRCQRIASADAVKNNKKIEAA